MAREGGVEPPTVGFGIRPPPGGSRTATLLYPMVAGRGHRPPRIRGSGFRWRTQRPVSRPETGLAADPSRPGR